MVGSGRAQTGMVASAASNAAGFALAITQAHTVTTDEFGHPPSAAGRAAAAQWLDRETGDDPDGPGSSATRADRLVPGRWGELLPADVWPLARPLLPFLAWELLATLSAMVPFVDHRALPAGRASLTVRSVLFGMLRRPGRYVSAH